MDSQAIIVLAIGFVNLAMLGWLGAAAAPLLIHLWSRRRYREVPWAAIEFLRAALRKKARQTQLQQWLLLAVRTLLIVSVVAALAEPFGERTFAGIGDGEPAHRIVVLDRSFSMGYRPGDDTLFVRAQQLAIGKIKVSGAGDRFSVISMSAPPEVVIRGPSLDAAAAIEAIREMEISESGGDLKATLKLVHELLTHSANGSGSFARQEVFFITDLGKTSWQDAQQEMGGGKSESVLQGVIGQIGELASIVVVDVGTPDMGNLAVVELSSASPVATTAAEVSFQGRLSNFGSQRREDVQIKLLVDGRALAYQPVDIPANGEAMVRFSQRISTPGDHTVELQLDGDRLEADNNRWLVVSVREQIRVLCVAGKKGEATHVARALDPEGNESTSTSPTRATVIADGQLRDTNLENYDCVVLCNVAQLTDDEATQLKQHLRRGGGLILFLGDRILADQYNQYFTFDESSPGIMPARLLEASNSTQYGIDPLGYHHPIVQPFRGRERAGLLTTPVSRYFRLQIPDTRPTTETVISLANGDPLVVAAAVERGRSLLVATAGSLVSIDTATGQPWSSMAAWPSFLPIVREMVSYAIAGNKSVSTSQVGELLSGQRLISPQESAQILRPDGRSEPITSTSNGWVYDATDMSGIYRINTPRINAPESPQKLFAVNLDPAESNLARVDVDLLAPQLIVQQGENGLPGKVTQSLPGNLSRQSPWAGNLLMAAMGLALLEVGLAWGMGGGRG